MRDYNIKIDIYKGYIHYFIDKEYLGMLVFEKGELSDFRAIIRKNRMNINNSNLYKVIRISLFELLNHFLRDRVFLDEEKLQMKKTEIVKKFDKYLQSIAIEIKDKGLL